MVTSCCAYGCTERAKKDGPSFHSFPCDSTLRKRWIIAIKRDDFIPTKNSRLCGKHFQESDYVIHFGQRRLKEGVVPSIFSFPPHLQKPKLKKRSRKIRTNSPSQDESKKLNIDPSCFPSTSIELDTAEQVSSVTQSNTAKSIIRKRKWNTREPIYFGDLKLKQLKSEEAKNVLRIATWQIEKQKSTIKLLRARQRRHLLKIKSLQDLIRHLKAKNKITSDCHNLLQECLTPGLNQLLLRKLRLTTSNTYPEELRSFALTLNFYSGTAYAYVRKMFGNCLPHPKTLTKWYRSVDGSPGYTQEALRAIEGKLKEHQNDGKPLICSLIMDEMSIRSHVQWNGDRQVGYVNYGFPMQGDSLPEAKDALVFLLVAVNGRWKIPISYFLINGIKAEEKAALVTGCLTILHDLGVTITSITFDGAATNLAMANVLGANFYNTRNLKPFFRHPSANYPVYLILDPCHMIKLVRNCLGDWGSFLDGSGNIINWNFFKLLVKLQDEEGLHAATKIRQRHMNYYKEKMKVKLAVQTFSESVADALLYCCKDLKLASFQGAEATANFCKHINNLFDILNTRNSLSKNRYKRPVSANNFGYLKNDLQEIKNYIYGLTDLNGVSLLISKRKTGFLGLLICMASVEGIIKDHILDKNNLKYLLTYKLSQDHIELFFSNIRSRGGFNNNPTAMQFESAYKKLLVHVELKGSETTNCLAQDETSILKISSKNKTHNSTDELDLLNSALEHDSDMLDVPHEFSKYNTDVVEYIAGFVCKKLINSFNCDICCSALTSNNSFSLLLNRKNKGGLTKPSKDVIYICQIAEKVFRGQQEINLRQGNVISRLILLGTRMVNLQNIFTTLNTHILDQCPLNNHLLQIIYNLFKNYFFIRLNHRNKTVNEIKDRIRHVYTKYIHFRNQ